MRPTDENQHGSTRPNLVSGARRPAGGEDNILARLDRDAARGAAGGSIAGGRRALYALGGLLILGLMAALAWLAHENAVTKRVLPGAAVVAEPAVMPAAAPVLAPAPAPPPPTIPKPALAVRPSAPAASRADLDPGEKIVEAAPAEIVTQAELPSMPPLVLLQPGSTPAPKPAAQTALRTTTRPTPAAFRKPAAPMAPAARAEPPAVDSDVALLSAIILHASSHAAERAQLESQGCGPGKKCAAKE